jgi:hypothetical protein
MITSIRDDLLCEIDAFLDRTGMEPSRLGKDAVNDPAFVHRLRAGADVRTRTVDRIRKFMAAHRPLARRKAKADVQTAA